MAIIHPEECCSQYYFYEKNDILFQQTKNNILKYEMYNNAGIKKVVKNIYI